MSSENQENWWPLQWVSKISYNLHIIPDPLNFQWFSDCFYPVDTEPDWYHVQKNYGNSYSAVMMTTDEYEIKYHLYNRQISQPIMHTFPLCLNFFLFVFHFLILSTFIANSFWLFLYFTSRVSVCCFSMNFNTITRILFLIDFQIGFRKKKDTWQNLFPLSAKEKTHTRKGLCFKWKYITFVTFYVWNYGLFNKIYDKYVNSLLF